MRRHAIMGTHVLYEHVFSCQPAVAGSRATLDIVSDEKTRFIAGGPRRVRAEGEGFWAFLRGWIASLFSVDRRM
jgi:hypothetical protein